MATEAELIESPLVGTKDHLPSPHDPSERALLHAQYGWQIRTYPWNSSQHLLYKTKGMLNLQLWYPEVGLSILTPSGLTGGQYEVRMGDEVVRVRRSLEVAELVHDWAGVRLPCSRVVHFYYYKMILLPYCGGSSHAVEFAS
ncbi:MAG: hypothetical protein VXW32_02665 [Myxococcota bacterium]|jgi:hypothetical protein|nr:hypothetical protein [Myxococcota bacterium]